MSSRSPESSEPPTCVHWFRLDSLRLHDNPSFTEASKSGLRLKPIYIIDPWFHSNQCQSCPQANVWRFLLESLLDLDAKLRKQPYSTRLNVLVGQPSKIIPELLKKWNARKLTFQASMFSAESVKHDEIMRLLCEQHGAHASSYHTHTLYDHVTVVGQNGGRMPQSYREFRHLLAKLGAPIAPISEPEPLSVYIANVVEDCEPVESSIPSLQDLGFSPDEALYTNSWVGGETEALAKLAHFCSRRLKQSDDPLSWLLSKDSLGPYLRFGCLSVRTLFSHIRQFASTSTAGHALFETITKNLLLREFSYMVGSSCTKFDEMCGNPHSIQLPWDHNPEHLAAWKEGKTGYPWIDAVVRQIREEGWAHFLARQSIAVFLTRGYLWLSWEHGLQFFQEFMLDFELPVSAVCWMQSSCSGFFCNQIESFDPCSVGKQLDTEGAFIKTYVPELQNFPTEYVHQPWKAPLHIQKQAGCVIGESYPKPVVEVCGQGELCCKRIQTLMRSLQEIYGEMSS